MMKRFTITIYIAFIFLFGIDAATLRWNTVFPGVYMSEAAMSLQGDSVKVSAQLNFKELKQGANYASVFTPVIVNGEQREELPPITVYGRTAWFKALRDGQSAGGVNEISYRYESRSDNQKYESSTKYKPWMEGARLFLVMTEKGCCRSTEPRESSPLAVFTGMGTKSTDRLSVIPELKYKRPEAETLKNRAVTGSAFIDFPVNSTTLNPDFRNNRAELAKILASIDSLRNDGDMTVTSLVITGTASPEGSYADNERLAKGRTEALRRYVDDLYHFGNDFIRTGFIPEDWEGLREWVATSVLPNKKEILLIIDDPSIDIDIKDKRIQARYGKEYLYMLENVYPSLRRSDYRIEFSVRGYNDIATIKKIMESAPQKLSLSEMFQLAQTLEPGSEEYNDVFETAVRMFPNDETANLNAANAALGRNDTARAERYLAKAGESGEAVYARGVLAALRGDKDNAVKLIRKSGEMGVEDTENSIRLLDSMAK